MVNIKLLSSVEAIVTGPQALADWREANTLPVPGHEHTPKFRAGVWDGRRRPGKWLRRDGAGWQMRCSVGLALRIADDLGITIPSQADEVGVALWTKTAPRVDELRDYQKDALRRALVRGWGRVALATNAGKGAVLALIARWARDHELSVLILCDELAVFDALKEELKAWSGLDERHGLRLVCSGRKAIPSLPGVTLAMVPTLSRRLNGEDADEWKEWVAQHQVVLLDEADKATASSWRSILASATNSRWRVGFSGSFPRDAFNALIVDELMGPVLAEARNKEMIELGISARPRVEIHRFDVTSSLVYRRARWPRRFTGTELRSMVYDDAIVDNEERHAALACLIRPEAKTVMVVNLIKHGHNLARAIPGSEFMDGGADEARRVATLEAFGRGDLNVLIVTRILDRGTNRLGAATDIIFASAEGSDRQLLQRIGRGLRRTAGKESLRLVDVMDTVKIADFPGDRRMEKVSSYLHEALARRLEVYNEEGFDLEIMRDH